MDSKNKRILVIDDSKTSRINIVTNLKKFNLNCEIVEAQDGFEGLKKLEDWSDYGLIFLDINMPVMDGLGFLIEAKKNGTIDKVPIVMITADDSRSMMVDALKKGATDYLVKPVVQSELGDILQKYYSGRQQN